MPDGDWATGLDSLGAAAFTAAGFFWKAGWAFVLGYFVSGMIQAFVPKAKLSRYLGDAGLSSVSLAAGFGAASSSCSFAALSAARSLFAKGAHFIATVAFMFASTNLVIELGILILVFLGWQFLVAEVLGGVLLIAVSSALIAMTYPRRWLEAAREVAERGAGDAEESFDWRFRIRSREGWDLVGHRFVMEWKMVWEEIVIGFTIAGFVAVLVPASVWSTIFLNNAAELPRWLVLIENAAVAPLVAGLTFIGSMGNIPLATVLNANGVTFAGVMGFIYSDLMVPPLVAVNAKYYGWRVALYIAIVMFASIVVTAVTLHLTFAYFGVTPESGRAVTDVARFAIDYTFWMNLLFLLLAVGLILAHRRHLGRTGGSHSNEGGMTFKRGVVYVLLFLLSAGWLLRATG